MFKVNLDKLTDFERQMVVMFEMHLPKVGVNDHVFQIPDMPAIQLGRWPFAKMMKPEQKNQAATWYRRLSWRGQIVAHQLHKRALQRPVEAPEKVSPVQSAAAMGVAAAQAAGQASLQGALNQQRAMTSAQLARGIANMPNGGLGNLYGRDSWGNPLTP